MFDQIRKYDWEEIIMVPDVSITNIITYRKTWNFNSFNFSLELNSKSKPVKFICLSKLRKDGFMQRTQWIGICSPDIAEAYEITKSSVRTIWPFYSYSVYCYGN